ncbi:MAG: hypothetical protein K1X78_11575 [Verrucomicrobiaceae bacterium]|nr:hypothetical protein [Verrucomicrobiaceae bacterium]
MNDATNTFSGFPLSNSRSTLRGWRSLRAGPLGCRGRGGGGEVGEDFETAGGGFAHLAVEIGRGVRGVRGGKPGVQVLLLQPGYFTKMR